MYFGRFLWTAHKDSKSQKGLEDDKSCFDT